MKENWFEDSRKAKSHGIVAYSNKVVLELIFRIATILSNYWGGGGVDGLLK